MEISFVLSWGSFFLGALALLLLEFLVMVFFAIRQAVKQRKKQNQTAGLLADLGEPLKKKR